jgi:mono/diheme cytochrome c family protein
MHDMRNLIAAIIVTSLSACAGTAAAGLTAADGKSLAQQYCTACHRVTKEQAQPPDVVVDTGTGPDTFQAPSFARIAARADRTEAQLRERILNPHYPMRAQQFIPEELDAIVAYILSLRAPGAAADW